MANRKMSPIKSIRKVEAFLNMTLKRGEKYFVIAKFQLNTGLRIIDVLQCRVSDIFLPSMRFREYFTLKEEKTDKIKQIKLNEELKRSIKTYAINSNLRYDDYLFPGRFPGTHISYYQVWRIFTEIADELILENFATHSLRKTWGYFSYKASKHNIALIMAMFNHDSERETLKYIGVDQDEKDRIYSVVKF